MPPPLPTPASQPLLRPAIIEFRYADQTQLDKAAAVYRGLLATPNERPVAGHKDVYTFAVGLDKEPDRKDLLLRLTCEQKAPGTVVYWKMAGDAKALDEAYQRLQQGGFQPVPGEEPSEYAVNNRPGLVSKRGLLEDETGGYLGLTINPPVPTATMQDDTKKGFFWQLVRFFESHGLAPDGRFIWVGLLSLGLLAGLCGLFFTLGRRSVQ